MDADYTPREVASLLGHGGANYFSFITHEVVSAAVALKQAKAFLASGGAHPHTNALTVSRTVGRVSNRAGSFRRPWLGSARRAAASRPNSTTSPPTIANTTIGPGNVDRRPSPRRSTSTALLRMTDSIAREPLVGDREHVAVQAALPDDM
jgi:hypothetical protein